MQVTGLKYGKRLLDLVEFPVAEVLSEEASHEQIDELIKKYGGKCVVKPVFLGGIGKKGKANLVRIANNVYEAFNAKKDLFFATHFQGNKEFQANGVTFESYIESEIEIYVNISASTVTRTPMLLITTEGGVDVEDVPPERKREVYFNPVTGLKSFHINDALHELNCPPQYISALVQHLPKLWQAYDAYGLTTLEINPIRMMKLKNGRYQPVACDIKAQFDQDNPEWKRLEYPPEIFLTGVTEFEAEINLLRTYQGQSDVVELNPNGTVLPFMFGGGANSVATEVLSGRAILSSDFGGNPPYDKMKAIADITFRHWLAKCNVVLVIGGKANNTDIFVTFKGIFDSLKENINLNPNIHVVIGRGGPNLIKGMTYARDLLDNMQIPYAIFGHDSSIVHVIQYAIDLDNYLIEKKSGTKKKEAVAV